MIPEAKKTVLAEGGIVHQIGQVCHAASGRYVLLQNLFGHY